MLEHVTKRKISMTIATITRIIKKLTSKEMYEINLKKIIIKITTEGQIRR